MHETKLAVIGLGYVGLPLAVQAAEEGLCVTGIDLNRTLVDKVNNRLSPFVNDERFDKALKYTPAKFLNATSSYDQLDIANTIIICVPTPTTNNVPDLEYVLAAGEEVGKHLKKGQLIVLESTVNPGVTRDQLLPLLESISGLKAGPDFALAHCPERIDPGNSVLHVGNLNRVVGGLTQTCTDRAQAFYESIIDAIIIPLGSLEEAEFVKSWENSHRNVMIALANQAARISDAMGMDINNILNGLQSKIDQFGLKLARPGIGPGGHCIPEDIHYVIQKARQVHVDTRLLEGSTELNEDMPAYAVSQLCKLMGEDYSTTKSMRVGVLGLSYKENIEDARRSPALEVVTRLIAKSFDVFVHDPLVPSTHPLPKGCTRLASVEDVLKECEILFVATAHDEYIHTLTPHFLDSYAIRYIYDGRNCLDKVALLESGYRYQGVGR